MGGARLALQPGAGHGDRTRRAAACFRLIRKPDGMWGHLAEIAALDEKQRSRILGNQLGRRTNAENHRLGAGRFGRCESGRWTIWF